MRLDILHVSSSCRSLPSPWSLSFWYQFFKFQDLMETKICNSRVRFLSRMSIASGVNFLDKVGGDHSNKVSVYTFSHARGKIIIRGCLIRPRRRSWSSSIWRLFWKIIEQKRWHYFHFLVQGHWHCSERLTLWSCVTIQTRKKIQFGRTRKMKFKQEKPKKA